MRIKSFTSLGKGELEALAVALQMKFSWTRKLNAT